MTDDDYRFHLKNIALGCSVSFDKDETMENMEHKISLKYILGGGRQDEPVTVWPLVHGPLSIHLPLTAEHREIVKNILLRVDGAPT